MVERSATIVTRMIRVVKNLWKEKIFLDMIKENIDNKEEKLNTEDIYKELKLRGYQYNGLFRSMHNISVSGSKGHIKWKKNWMYLYNYLKILMLSKQEAYNCSKEMYNIRLNMIAWKESIHPIIE
ncbi:hypothetical protein HZH68_004969 [Vespula germanica]|uniref:Uncharacterized protein n=1 Tax=Vespula germanica TaxID=30212 RepID=A0A834ND28_VESGE|nr:hypothetical protein HZH68_004969 [Vespula germanica]